MVLGAALLLAWAPALADDLTASERFLCSATSLVICWDDGTCETGSAAEINIPQFIEIDLAQKRLSTTEASGLNRATEIGAVQRDEDTIVLQGYEGGRAFSFVVAEKTGSLSAAIAGDGRNVAAFGMCTPLPASR
jgi:hypothetical protein